MQLIWCRFILVAPLAGAWIEIKEENIRLLEEQKSLPSRERGLKSADRTAGNCAVSVAPLAGAWIEIMGDEYKMPPVGVAPLAGAWIEIQRRFLNAPLLLSRSPRGSVD